MSSLSLQLLKKCLFNISFTKFNVFRFVNIFSFGFCISILAILSTLRSQGVSHLSLEGSEVLPLTPRCLTHIELAFVCGSREGSDFIHLYGQRIPTHPAAHTLPRMCASGCPLPSCPIWPGHAMLSKNRDRTSGLAMWCGSTSLQINIGYSWSLVLNKL